MEADQKPPAKKIWVILAIIGSLGTLFGLVWAFRKPLGRRLGWLEKEASPSPAVKSSHFQVEKEKFNFSWALWEDPAGFSFEYPRQLEIDVHPEDEVNYAHLELSKPGRAGQIIILCNDTDYATVDEWAENDELVKRGSSLDTQVASMAAKKVALGGNREITGLIDWDRVIYTIDKQAGAEDEFWQAIYKRIIETFELIPLEGETQAEFNKWLEGFDTSGVDVVAPVEVIEF